MNQPNITLVINGNTYSLRASDTESIGKIPKADRQQLTTLLEAIKREEQRSEAAVQRTVDDLKLGPQAATKRIDAESMPGRKIPHPERLGSGDVDNLMSRLILEEKQKQKPGLTKTTIYKWTAGIFVAIILIVLIF